MKPLRSSMKIFDIYRDEYGYVRGHKSPNGEVYVSEVYIYPKFRGQGHGKKMLEQIPAGAELQVSSLPEQDGSFYSTTEQLVKFYSSNGFVIGMDCFQNIIATKI